MTTTPENNGHVAAYRRAIKQLLDLVGASVERPCKLCGKPIRFVATVGGRRAPVTTDGVVHFADCPHASAFRRGGA